MQDKTFVPFTKEMKETYTILVPNMLPMHFKLIVSVFRTYGYHMELLETTGPEIAEIGLKYTHNDTCYPAVLVIGQFMEALLSGRYDPDKTAVIMSQTGGGCRASNYLPLIRKALAKAGLERVPVISLGVAGVEKHPGFELSVPILHGLMYAILYGDLMMTLVNQVRTYERTPGDAEALAAQWTEKLGRELGSGSTIRYADVRANNRRIIDAFAAIPLRARAAGEPDAVRVGIVGEIFIKYSPLGNNQLERFLVREGAEVIVPGLFDFILFYVHHTIMEHDLYGCGGAKYIAYRLAFSLFCRKKDDISRMLAESGVFRAWTPFPDMIRMVEGYISTGAKMGEGWLLAAEMLELIHAGCRNIVCAQPFGCLPNHICGKGMMKPIKERNPDVNIVAIDYDAGASRVNQENRLKLMLFNARRNDVRVRVDA